MSAYQIEKTMHVSATDKLTSAFLQRLRHQVHRAAILGMLLIAISFTWLGLPLVNNLVPGRLALFSNGMYTLTSLVGAYWTFSAVYRARRGPLVLRRYHCLAWLLIGLGLVANAMGNIYNSYYQITFSQDVPIPTYRDSGTTL